MKKIQLKNLIREEIRKVLNENEFESFLQSLNIDTSKDTHSDRGIDIGSDVTVIKHGQGVVTDVDSKNKKYTVKVSKGNVVVPFQFVQPIKITGEDFKLLNAIKKLEKEHKSYVKTFISNLANFKSSNYRDDFQDEKWKLNSIAKFYLEIGQQLWDMFKQNKEYIIHSDEFEDLFIDISILLDTLYKVDNGANKDLENVVLAYKKIGKKIGAGIE